VFSKRFLGETSKTKETLIFIIFCKQLIQQLVKKSGSFAFFSALWLKPHKNTKETLVPIFAKVDPAISNN
jgi:hypothetical protein